MQAALLACVLGVGGKPLVLTLLGGRGRHDDPLLVEFFSDTLDPVFNETAKLVEYHLDDDVKFTSASAEGINVVTLPESQSWYV